MAGEKMDYDCVIVGAGISGINFAYRLQERVPNLSYCILEGREEMGGTWSLFKYPGIRSDSDLYTFGFPWRPWESQSPIAEGPKILEYMKESAAMYGIDKKIQYNHSVNAANFSSASKTWSIDVTANGSEHKTIRSRWMLMCTGYYDYKEPLKASIPGIDTFQGEVIHPQFWPEDLDYTDKNVVIIGSGATAITLLPNVAKKAKQTTILQRSPSYIMSMPKEDKLETLIRKLTWWSKPLEHKLIRWKWLFIPFLFTRFCLYFPKAARKAVSKAMSKELGPDISPDPHFNPTYNPFEQRLCFCPDSDFYQALRSGKASVATGHIDTVTEDTITLTDGQELHPDIIVTATGLKLRFAGGVNFSIDDQPYNVGEKFIWKGVMIEDLPNAAYVFGYVDASWTLGADATAQMIIRLMKQMRKEGVGEVVPRRSQHEKEHMEEAPLLRLTSTYITKAKNVLPKAGATGQWRPRSFYYQDILMAWFGDLKSGMEWIRGV
ncbi:FAD/NAD(P)-binding domain-containing protein [Teratosphaeria nubilosa]|uniref:FAD/NAD(P)-binding domain-containing protein n=1 Tax=Teratosphaeria nubilosa TaxID=161662 RepID=A0A6G1LBP2_9PEZI|nr:FAD/NAD(P)-binding domain-containing protein [Teratosphaeria nubilosa]